MCSTIRLGVAVLLVVVIITPQYSCNPLFPFYPWNRSSTSPQTTAGTTSPVRRSNVTVALGNRVNTQAALDDYGTNVDGATINIDRRRRRRDIFDLPTLLGPHAPNGSFIAVNNQVFQLPNNLSNVSLNISSLPGSLQTLNLSQTSFLPTIAENYTNAFQTLLTGFQTVPLDVLDNIVQLLSTGYKNTFGQLFIQQSLQRINQTVAYGSSVVESGLNNISGQVGQGFEQIIAQFNSSTGAVRRCVSDNLNPSRVAQNIVGKGYGCVNRKWQELVKLAGNIGQDIVTADNGSSQFLTNLTACNGANVGASQSSPLSASQRNVLRRRCYVRVVGSFPQELLFLPFSLAIDGTRLYAAVSGLESDIAACGGEVAVEIGMNVAQIGSRIVLCEVFSL